MADAAVSPTLAASIPAVALPLLDPYAGFLIDIGLDPARMVAGLIGVIIIQTVLPRSETSWKSIASLAGGSMLFASFAAPFAYAWLLKKSPPAEADWLYSVDTKQLKAVIAGFLGGTAQPLLLLGRVAVLKAGNKFFPSVFPAPPVVKEPE